MIQREPFTEQLLLNEILFVNCATLKDKHYQNKKYNYEKIIRNYRCCCSCLDIGIMRRWKV